MNDYIMVDGYRYKTLTNWVPYEDRPMTIKRLMSGGADVTFGPATYKYWRGTICVDVSPANLYGGVSEFKASYRKASSVEFVDHFGETHQVVIDRGIDERSLSPMWSAPENTINVNVTLVKL
jgi:hypothetical protein